MLCRKGENRSFLSAVVKCYTNVKSVKENYNPLCFAESFLCIYYSCYCIIKPTYLITQKNAFLQLFQLGIAKIFRKYCIYIRDISYILYKLINFHYHKFFRCVLQMCEYLPWVEQWCQQRSQKDRTQRKVGCWNTRKT